MSLHVDVFPFETGSWNGIILKCNIPALIVRIRQLTQTPPTKILNSFSRYTVAVLSMTAGAERSVSEEGARLISLAGF